MIKPHEHVGGREARCWTCGGWHDSPLHDTTEESWRSIIGWVVLGGLLMLAIAAILAVVS